MELKGKYIIATSREAVWAALNDPDVLRECIPGCESLTKKSDTEFDADVVAKIGPVKAKFKTTVKLENIQAPESYTLVGNGKGGGAGFGRGKADVKLVSVDEGTELSYAADFKVGGKLAQVGSRLVAGATKKTADEFFGSFSASLDPEAAKVEEEVPAGRSLSMGWLAAAVGVGGFLIWWLLLR